MLSSLLCNSIIYCTVRALVTGGDNSFTVFPAFFSANNSHGSLSCLNAGGLCTSTTHTSIPPPSKFFEIDISTNGLSFGKNFRTVGWNLSSMFFSNPVNLFCRTLSEILGSFRSSTVVCVMRSVKLNNPSPPGVVHSFGSVCAYLSKNSSKSLSVWHIGTPVSVVGSLFILDSVSATTKFFPHDCRSIKSNPHANMYLLILETCLSVGSM